MNSGYTLMEMLVSIALFSIVVMASIGVMIMVFGSQSKAIALKDVIDNARFSLELITRELRTGTNFKYSTPPGCPSQGIQFTSYNQGSAQERFYYLSDTDADGEYDAIMRVAMLVAGSVDCNLAQQFTAPEIKVYLVWSVIYGGTLGPTDGQPRISISMTVRSRNPRPGQDTSFTLQTTVTQRERDAL
ncbi:MAG: prepilin-type N-terminal cleavage/methylation domain-containing protein [bacterium]|nr:prepilin-type N-terminal cleavage/methylation domain-containing protein [bacterium]